jgi:hypothetical protein
MARTVIKRKKGAGKTRLLFCALIALVIVPVIFTVLSVFDMGPINLIPSNAATKMDDKTIASAFVSWYAHDYMDAMVKYYDYNPIAYRDNDYETLFTFEEKFRLVLSEVELMSNDKPSVRVHLKDNAYVYSDGSASYSFEFRINGDFKAIRMVFDDSQLNSHTECVVAGDNSGFYLQTGVMDGIAQTRNLFFNGERGSYKVDLNRVSIFSGIPTGFAGEISKF